MRHVALKVPLRPLSFGGFGQTDDVNLAGVEPLGNGADQPAFAGRAAAGAIGQFLPADL